MKYDINIQEQKGVKLTLYPDNQPHVNITHALKPNDEVRVVAHLRSSLELMNLLEVSNALDNMFVKKTELVIPYLLGARFDRLMQPGDSVDLKVVADLINLCRFDRVNLFDVHSDVATQLIHKSYNHNNSKLVFAYTKPQSILICPDAGAAKKVGKYLDWNTNLVDVVYCMKTRDLSNGRINLKVYEPEKCAGKDCVIIDDICDGGATFTSIAEQIKPASLTLIVSHGIFSKGFSTLEKYFNKIITSDSYANHSGSKILTTISLNL